MSARVEAVLSLLADSDPHTVRLVTEQLITSPELLEEVRARAEGEVGQVLADVLWEKRLPDRISEVERCLLDLDSLDGLERFCWALSAAGRAQPQIAEAQREINLWGDRLRERLSDVRGGNERLLVAIRELLAYEIGLHGDNETYESPENSFLDAVVIRRRGLPISLSVLYMMVGARAGIRVDGVAAPGHFLAKIGTTYFDPFNHAEPVPKEA
ncbi:MAG: transglutaminase-like domain-containing protein, partial [Verrucomicrobiia bacterium]